MVVGFLSPNMSLSSQAGRPNYITDHSVPREYRRDIKLVSMRQRQILPPNRLCCGNGDEISPRVFVLSDLHTEYAENMSWVKCLSTVRYKKDVLLVAGDVAETYTNFISTMSMLKDRFQSVFYIPGNHDLWCRRDDEIYLDSLEKLNALLDACRGLEVETSPRIVDGMGIIPLFSWYHESFDKEKDVTGIRIPSLEMVCKDFHACKWPQELSSQDISLAQYFDKLNERNCESVEEIQRSCSKIITFSHFVPRQELCPEKRMLFYPNLPKIIGSDYLEARLRSIHGVNGNSFACHVFGHTHFCWDAMLDGICPSTLGLSKREEKKNEWGCRLVAILHLL
ncbi:uncharacterized protein LOC143864379 isoform X2 [Tasmannia lanceolata]|uniref:uncharacterized protein LOC143864379 isoform X2 n=1 Tax=Tasmannia lanceolata TaxID=3420 RepID=UPI004062E32A